MSERSIFDLDQYHLDYEWVQQPKLFHEYATKLAYARKTHEEAKSARDLVVAELDRRIRLTPSEFHIEKVTETVVSNTILLQPEYQKANSELIESKHFVDTLYAMTEALDHRKKALENLVSLQARDYFSEPRVDDTDVQEVMEEKRKKEIRKRGQTKRGE